MCGRLGKDEWRRGTPREEKKKSGVWEHAGQGVPVVCLQLSLLCLRSSTMRFVRLVSFHNNPIPPLKSIAAIATSTHVLDGFESKTPAALGLGRCDVVVLADVVVADVMVADVVVANVVLVDELFALVSTVSSVELGALESAIEDSANPEVPAKEKVVLGPMISEGLIVKVRPSETSVVDVPTVMVWLPKRMTEGPRTTTGRPSILPVVLGPAGTAGARVPVGTPGKAKVALGPTISEGLIVKVRPSETIVVGVLMAIV
jgi:fumarate reductase subunit C